MVLAAPAPAQHKPLPQDLQLRVNKAIDDGVAYLKTTQNPLGTWTTPDKDQHLLGYAALGGLTLLVCGVPADDPVVQKAAHAVRLASPSTDKTYELALSILFLDKLGEVQKDKAGQGKKTKTVEAKWDRERIETMALRLMAGQTPSGGWTYRCPPLTTKQQGHLKTALRAKKVSKSSLGDLRDLPVLQDPAKLTFIDPPGKIQTPIWGTTDNSNTQFAILAIWAARRHGLPVDRTLRLIVKRFEKGQNNDGSWSYLYKLGGGLPEGPAMNCVGLLGLAIGNGLTSDAAGKDAPPEFKAAGIVGCPGLAALLVGMEGINKQLAIREGIKNREKDKRVLDGFVALDKHVGQPTGKMENLPLTSLYLLWSIERVAVLYGLPVLGQKDWYRWGAEMLVANQAAPGNWQGGGYTGSAPPVDTCLALLFLKRANLTSDLSTTLAGTAGNLAKDLSDKLPGGEEKKETMAPPALSALFGRTATPPIATPAPPAPEPTPKRAAPVARSAPAPERETPAPKESGGNTILFVILGLVALLLVGGGVLVFFLTRSSEEDDDEEEEEAPRKKKKKPSKNH